MKPFTITMVKEDAQKLILELAAANVDTTSAEARRNSGMDIYITVLLPTTLAAVQVVATFLAARSAKPPGGTGGNKADEGRETANGEPKQAHTAPVQIKIGSMMIGEKSFSIQAIEHELGEALK